MATIPDNFELQVGTIPQQKIHDNRVFPLVLRKKESSSFTTAEEWTNWANDNKDLLRSQLTTYGAILFKGLPLDTPEQFDKFVKAFNYGVFPYIGGAAPRKIVTGDVFTTNEAPPDQLIPFHHEMAQVPNPPAVLYFYCNIAPGSGGQTPIIYSPAAYQSIRDKQPEFVARLEREGVHYTRVLPDGDDPSSPIGRGWQSTFAVSTREEAEAAAGKQGITFEWTEEGYLKTTTAVLPGVREDTRTGKKTWFNSIIAAFLGWQDSRNDRRKAVTFPNGDYMPESAMKSVEETMEELAVDFTWGAGDVCMIDNRQALHGRRSFDPPRRILAALCKENP